MAAVTGPDTGATATTPPPDPRRYGPAVGRGGHGGDSVVAAHVIAERTGSAERLTSANSAYVHGMGVVLLMSGVAALVAALLAALLAAPLAALLAALLAGAFLPNAPSGTQDMATDRPDGRQ